MKRVKIATFLVILAVLLAGTAYVVGRVRNSSQTVAAFNQEMWKNRCAEATMAVLPDLNTHLRDAGFSFDLARTDFISLQQQNTIRFDGLLCNSERNELYGRFKATLNYRDQNLQPSSIDLNLHINKRKVNSIRVEYETDDFAQLEGKRFALDLASVKEKSGLFGEEALIDNSDKKDVIVGVRFLWPLKFGATTAYTRRELPEAFMLNDVPKAAKILSLIFKQTPVAVSCRRISSSEADPQFDQYCLTDAWLTNYSGMIAKVVISRTCKANGSDAKVTLTVKSINNLSRLINQKDVLITYDPGSDGDKVGHPERLMILFHGQEKEINQLTIEYAADYDVLEALRSIAPKADRSIDTEPSPPRTMPGDPSLPSIMGKGR